MLQKNTRASCLHMLPTIAFAKGGKTWNARHFALEEARKEAEGINVANVAVGDKAILFPLNMSAENHLR